MTQFSNLVKSKYFQPSCLIPYVYILPFPNSVSQEPSVLLFVLLFNKILTTTFPFKLPSSTLKSPWLQPSSYVVCKVCDNAVPIFYSKFFLPLIIVIQSMFLSIQPLFTFQNSSLFFSTSFPQDTSCLILKGG